MASLSQAATNCLRIALGASYGVFDEIRDRIESASIGQLVATTAATSITAALHSGKTVMLNGSGASLAMTLPAASGTGNRYRFVVGTVNTSNHVIKVANASDVMAGTVWANSTGDTPDLGQPWPTAADSDTITLNGTTTGGAAIGDYIEVQDIAANKWLVIGFTNASGAEATPFSAGV